MKHFPNVEVLKTAQLLCLACKQPLKVIYGRWGHSGTCSRQCEDLYKKNKKLETHYE